MERTKTTFFLIFILVFASAFALLSGGPKIHTYKSQKDFEKGKPKGVSINSYGELRLAPEIQEIFKPDLPFIWSAVADRKGNLYLAGGNTGQVFKVDKDSNSSMAFDSEEQQIYALTVDKKNNLYIGTSPEGKIYKVTSAGILEDAVFFDPQEVYIWSMAMDNRNNLFVATGEKGNIYKIDQNKQSSLFFASEDAHIRKIVLDSAGNLIAGTANKGQIIQIDATGKAFVLYDSPLVEITDLLVESGGDIFAAAAGESRIQRRTPSVPTPPAANLNESSENARPEDDVLDLPVQNISSGGGSFGKQGSALYKIEPDGSVKTVWTSNKARIHAIVQNENGEVVVGTGAPGRLYRINEVGEHTLLTEFDELQITNLLRISSERIFVSCSNPGKIYRVQAGNKAEGEYTSEVIDAKAQSQWGALNWEAEVPEDTRIGFYTRSGNTEEPDKTWSDWSKKYTDLTGHNITSPPARFIQFKAALSSVNGKMTPVLKEVTLSYLQKNMPPKITEITIHPAGDYYPSSQNNVASNSHINDKHAPGQNNVPNSYPGRKTFRKGFRSISWKARDGNGDKLSFDLFYKGENEKSWKTLVENHLGFLYSWDSELFADGRYFIKIVASDDVSNPESLSLSAQKISQPFKVDNTGPRVSDLRVSSKKNHTTISFTVTDELMSVRTVEYGVNAEDWKLIYPVDGICDSKTERFEIQIKPALKGDNTVVVKAKDELGNTGFGKKNLKL